MGVADDELMRFLDFAAMFLGNIGNFYVRYLRITRLDHI